MSTEDLGKQFRGSLVDGSSNRFDSRMTTFADADYLFNTAQYYPCARYIPTTTGYGFVKDKAVRRNADNNNWIAEDLTKHFHDANTDESGGAFSDIERRNVGYALRWLHNTYDASDFYVQNSGTSSGVTDVLSGAIGRIDVTSGTTTNGYADASIHGVALSFADDYALIMMLEHEGNLTNYVLRAGINAEMINLSNSTTQASEGIESCSASGSNVLGWSCKPPNRTTIMTGYSHDQNVHSWLLQHIVADGKLYIVRDLDFQNVVIKSDNIPISGYTESRTLFGMGMKTQDTSSKILRYYGASIGAAYGDPIWRFDASDNTI